MVSKIYKKIKKTLQMARNDFRRIFAKKIYVSFGENCLADNILERHQLKTITTPFSHGRSNIEYILQLEKDNYKDFLNIEFLQFEDLNGKKVPRLKKYNSTKNNYHHLHSNGFEFTHHDVINSLEIREKLVNRTIKLRNIIGHKKIIILYHHRVNATTNMQQLLEDLNTLKKIYSFGKYNAEIIFFKQNIINNKDDRKVIYNIDNLIHKFTFHTIDQWEGDDAGLLWATNDEDLILEMISIIKKI